MNENGARAGVPNAAPSTDDTSILKPSYSHLLPSRLLEHFHQRPHIRFRPIIDAEHLRKAAIDMTLDDCFDFNGERHCYPSGVKWQHNPSQDIEWLIMLQKSYFFVGLGYQFQRTANRCYLEKWVALSRSWIAQNEPGVIASDVTGRRIQNWIFAFYYFVHDNSGSRMPADFLPLFLQALHQQVEYLIDNLTAARNHRTLELYALFLAAVVFPEFRRADHWRRFAVEALAENAGTDILPDGAHCELSTFYHQVVLKNLLAVKELAAGNAIDLPAAFDRAVCRALDFSAHVHKPDGRIPSLSDGDCGSFTDLLESGARLYGHPTARFVASRGNAPGPEPVRSRAFPDAGYYVLRGAWRDTRRAWEDSPYLIFDCGPIGAGNHGHLDLLSIEVAARGRSLIVDPGRYTYDESGAVNWRALFRGTAYHNTVSVDGKNQTRYRHSPRHGKHRILGEHARGKLLGFVSEQDFDYLQGSVASAEYSAIHERRIFFAAGEYWLIWDWLHDTEPHDYCLAFHLGAEANGHTHHYRGETTHQVHSPNLLVAQLERDNTWFDLSDGWVSPVYGTRLAAPILHYHRYQRETTFETLLIPFDEQMPEVEMAELSSGPGISLIECRIRCDQGNFHDHYYLARHANRRSWNHGRMRCSGSFCHWRLDAAGEIVHAFAAPDSKLLMNGEPIATGSDLS